MRWCVLARDAAAGTQEEGNKTLRKMCKDRYVLICMSFFSFSVVNAAGA